MDTFKTTQKTLNGTKLNVMIPLLEIQLDSEPLKTCTWESMAFRSGDLIMLPWVNLSKSVSILLQPCKNQHTELSPPPMLFQINHGQPQIKGLDNGGKSSS